MELTQLKYFVKLAEELNFTEAAKQLFITQSTLSLSIKRLEDECGTPLFDRIGKCTYLTDAGRVFADFAKRAIKETESGVMCMNEMSGIYTGKLHIGVTYSLHDILNDCILQFVEKYPDAGLSIIESNSVKDLEQMVLRGEIDFALTYATAKMSNLIECTPLFETPLCVIAQKKHPIVSLKKIPLSELGKFPFVLFPYGINTRMEIEKMFSSNNVPMINPRIEVNDAGLILQMVETGKWLTILSEGVVRRRKNLKAVGISSRTSNKLNGCLIRTKEKYVSVMEKYFYKIIKDYWGKK
jgi:LysR family cyn operon transcriptional activator